jgi:Tol biopolymer transport system component
MSGTRSAAFCFSAASRAAALVLLAALASPPLTRAEMRTLPVRLGGEATWPVACSDGRRLAFGQNAGKSGDVFTLDLTDSAATPNRLTNWEKWDGKPSWSPDCSRIAFMSSRSGDEDIWVLSLATGEFKQMTFSYEGPGLRAQEWGPAWSPDGSRIAFSSDRSGDDDIWWVPAEGGEPVRVTKRTLARQRDQDRYPTWAPDGKRIAYASQTSGNWDVWVATVDDTSSAPVRLTPDSTGEWSPAWSPNGRWIVFCSDRTGNVDLFVMPAEGGEAKRLTQNPGSDLYPSWSHDGRKVYYSARRGEESGIWAMDGLEDVLGADFAARAGAKRSGRAVGRGK